MGGSDSRHHHHFHRDAPVSVASRTTHHAPRALPWVGPQEQHLPRERTPPPSSQGAAATQGLPHRDWQPCTGLGETEGLRFQPSRFTLQHRMGGIVRVHLAHRPRDLRSLNSGRGSCLAQSGASAPTQAAPTSCHSARAVSITGNRGTRGIRLSYPSEPEDRGSSVGRRAGGRLRAIVQRAMPVLNDKGEHPTTLPPPPLSLTKHAE